MTQTSKIAILGAGIMGLSTASALSEAGHKVTIFDPAGFPAENASAMAGGMLAPYSEIEHMPTNWIKAGLQGINHWKLSSKTHNIDFHQNGSLLLAHTEDRYILERFKAHLPPEAYTQSPPPQQLAKFKSGLFLGEEAHLNPSAALSALQDTAQTQGATLCKEFMSPEHIPSEFDFVIDCRGMAANDPELRGVKGEIAYVHNTEFTINCPIRLMHPRYPLYIVPRGNNVFMIGATQIESDNSKTVSLRSAMELLSALYSLHPSFGDAEILDIKAGIRPAYPDNLPRITIRGNVISCNGLFRHGYLLAPVMAACVKDFIQGKEHEFFNLFTGESYENHHQRPGKKFRSAA